MASRFAFRLSQPLKLCLASTGAAATVGLSLPVAFADSKKPTAAPIYDEDDSIGQAPLAGSSAPAVTSKSQESSTLQKELSIKNETVDGVKVYTSDFLEKNVEKTRKFLADKIDLASEKLHTLSNQYINAEKNVSNTAIGLKADNEDLLPASIYILVCALSGSIIARRRGILLRAVTPVVFGVAAFSYFLPATFKNTSAFVWKYEEKVPVIADAHLKTLDAIEETKKTSKSVAEWSEQSLTNGVHTVRTTIADLTGLQLPEDTSAKPNKN